MLPKQFDRPQVEAVREEIYRMKGRDPAAKVLIFSQFTSMLDILHYRLTQVRPRHSGVSFRGANRGMSVVSLLSVAAAEPVLPSVSAAPPALVLCT